MPNDFNYSSWKVVPSRGAKFAFRTGNELASYEQKFLTATRLNMASLPSLLIIFTFIYHSVSSTAVRTRLMQPCTADGQCLIDLDTTYDSSTYSNTSIFTIYFVNVTQFKINNDKQTCSCSNI